MTIMYSCCFFSTLRRASYASVIYTTIYFSISCITVAAFLHEEHLDLRKELSRPVIRKNFLDKEIISATTVIFNILLLVCATFGVLSSLLVVIGLRQDKRELLLPWIFVMITDSLVEFGHFLYLIIIEKVAFEPLTATLFTIDFFIIVLNIYCLLCVISQYQEYKAGRGCAPVDDTFNCTTDGLHYNLPTVNPIYLNNILKPSKQSQNTQCQNRNCSGDETQLNGANSNSCGNQFRNKNAIYNKKHVEFPNDIKYCHDEQLSTALPDGGHGKNGDHLSSFDTLPECNEDIISWQEHNLDSN